MTDEHTEQSLPVTMRRREDQGVVEFGVTFEGAFVPLGAVKLGHLDKLVTLAKTQAEQESQSDSES